MVLPQHSRHFYEFGSFRLDPEKHRLLRDGEPIHLSPKSVEALLVLVQNAGKLLERETLMQAVWADTFVEDANLTVAISHLRKALGQNGDSSEYIETIPRVGYRFVAEVREAYEDPRPLIIEKHTQSSTIIEEEEVPDDVDFTSEDLPSQALAYGRASDTSQTRMPARRLRFRFSVATAAALVVVAITFGVFVLNAERVPSVRRQINSIAVLPVTPLSENPDDRALSLGFTDALITSLGSVNQVRVISNGTLSRSTDLRKEPAEIGKQFGADSVLEGTLQHTAGKLRVTLRLIRTADGAQLWGKSFDENDSEIFRLEDTMALQTARAFSENLRPKELKRTTEDREAYQAYLRGRFFFDKRTPEAYEKAIAEFGQAIVLDPNYALAYAGLADVYAMQALEVTGEPRDALYEKSKTAVAKSLQLDETTAEAHTTLAWIKRIHEWDWVGAEREFKRAIELNPNYVNAHQWYALLLTTLGRRDEALAEIERARELEPLSRVVLSNYLTVRAYRRENELLVPIAEQITSLDDSSRESDRDLAAAYLRAGDAEKAVKLDDRFLASLPNKVVPSDVATTLAIAYTRAGQQKKALEMLDSLEQQVAQKAGTAAPYRLALAYSALERKDQAIAVLQKCVEARDERLMWLRVEPYFDSLRDDARFQEMLRKMNL